MPADGYLNFNTKIDTDGFKKGVKDVEASTKSFGGTLDKLSGKIAAVFSVAAVAAFGKATIESAARVKAAGSQFTQTFNDMADEAQAAISRVAGPADILETRLHGAATSIYAFAKTAKMETSTAMTFMEDALQAAADSAAYYDRSIEETTETLKSFLKGNYANDAALGLSATETTRNAKAMEMYGKKFIDLSEAQKQLALLEMVKDANRLSGAMGQAAREADGWENVTGNLSEAWDKLLAAVGQPLLKLAVPVVQHMTGALTQMTTWANNAYSALAKVFGWQEAQTTEINASVDAQDALTESVEATAAAQEKALAGFDEIEVLASGTADSGGAGTSADGSGVIASGMEAIADDAALGGTYEKLSAISDELDEIKETFLTGFWESFENVDFSGIELSLESISTSVKGIFSDENLAGAARNWISTLSYIFGQIAGSVASIATTIAQNLTGGIALYLDENSDVITNAITGTLDASASIAESVGNTWSAFSNIFSVLTTENGQALTGNIVGIFANAGMGIAELATKTGADFVNLLTQPIVDNQDSIKGALDGTVGTFASVTGSVKSLVDGLVEDVLALYDEHISPFVDTLTATLSEWVGKFTEAYEEHIQPILDEFAAEFSILVEEKLKPMFEKVTEFIGNAADKVTWLWENVLKKVGAWIIDVFVDNFSKAFKAVKDVVMVALFQISGFINNFLSILNSITDFIEGVFTRDSKKAWEGLAGIVTGIINTIISAFETGINGIITGINGVIGAVDTVVGTVGGVIGFEWNIPPIEKITLPRLASGAVIPPNREFLAVLGDQKNGTNIEAPLDTILEAFRAALAESRGSGVTEVVLEIDGREFGRAVVEQGERENRRVGTRLVVI